MAKSLSHSRPRTQAERSRASNLKLAREKGQRKNYRFTAEMLRHLAILKSLNEYRDLDETRIIAAILKSRVGRRTRPHEPQLHDKRRPLRGGTLKKTDG